MNYSNEITLAIKHLSKNDKIIFRIIKNFGNCNLQPRRKYFNAILQSIIGQQLSVKSANSIIKKFFEYFDGNPTAELIMNAPHEDLRFVGLSNAKTVYVKDLSNKILNREINLNAISKKSDEEVIEELTKVKGIGPWTCHMFLIFVLFRLNILPVNDLGIKRAIMLNYNLKNFPTESEIIKLSKKMKWDPYQSVASWYLWKSLE